MRSIRIGDNFKFYIGVLGGIITMLKKTIKVSEKTHRRLSLLGDKWESFDNIINKLIDKKVRRLSSENGVQKKKSRR